MCDVCVKRGSWFLCDIFNCRYIFLFLFTCLFRGQKKKSLDVYYFNNHHYTFTTSFFIQKKKKEAGGRGVEGEVMFGC